MPAGHSEKGPHKGANKIRLAFGQINLIETKYVDHQFSFFCSSDDSLKKNDLFFQLKCRTFDSRSSSSARSKRWWTFSGSDVDDMDVVDDVGPSF